MPLIPRYLQQVIPTGGRRADTTDFGGDRGYGALGQALGTVEQVAEQAYKANEQKKLTASVAGAGIELATIKSDLAQNPDYSTHLDEYDARVEELHKNTEKALGSRGYANFKANTRVAFATNRIAASTNATKGVRNQAEAQLDINLVTIADNASKAESQQERLAYQLQAVNAIQEAERTLVLTPQEAVKRQQKFINTTLLTDIRVSMRNDPESTVKDLLDPSGPYGRLTEEQRQRSTDSAIKAYDTALRKEDISARQRERVSLNREKVIQAETAKDGHELVAQGNLAVLDEWTSANRENLTEGKYKYFLGVADGRGEAVADDRNIASDLIFRASNGEDVRSESEDAFDNYDLTQGTKEDIYGIVEKGGVLPRHFKQGQNYINTALAADRSAVPFAAQIRLADATSEWNEWTTKNPEATPQETRAESARIVGSYAIIDADELAISLKPARYATGDRLDPDLKATAQATMDARDSGDLTQEEYEDQMELLDKWSDVAKSRAEAAAARERAKQ